MSISDRKRSRRHRDIPDSWSLMPLSKIASINPSRQLEKGKSYPYLPMEALATDSKHHGSPETRVWNGSGGAKFQAGDVLLARITPSAENGKTAIASSIFNDGGFGSTELVVLSPREKISTSDFIYYVIKDENVRNRLIEHMTGSTGRQRIPVDALDLVEIPLPPIHELHRIGALFSSIDEALEASKAVLEQLDAVKRKTSYELFTKDSTTSAPGRYVKHFGEVPRGWCLTTLGELSSFVTSGPRGWAKYYAEQGAAYMRIGDLAKHSIDLALGSTQCVDPPENAEGVRTQVRPDDLLISITADLGITNIAPEDIGKTFINQHIALVRIKKGSANPRCLAYWFQLGPGKRQFKRLSDQGAKSGLNLTSVRSMKVALPSLKAQATIVEALDLIEHNVALCKKKISAIENLKRGLMQQLLTGKLRVAVDNG